MPNGMRWVGLDVHAHASSVAIFDDASGEVITRRVNGRPIEVLDVLRELPGPVRAVIIPKLRVRGMEVVMSLRRPSGVVMKERRSRTLLSSR